MLFLCSPFAWEETAEKQMSEQKNRKKQRDTEKERHGKKEETDEWAKRERKE